MNVAVIVTPHVAGLRRRACLLGPALIAAAAYVDPGNVATNTAGGARYGYLLLWVIAIANLMAGLVQYLSAKLGLVTGQSLPEALRDRLPRAGRLAYWLQAEVVSMATDIAEVLGGAIALLLLFDLPLLLGGAVTVLVSMAVLQIQARHGQRRLEYVIATMLGVVAVGFLTGVVVQPPDAGRAAHGLVPHLAGNGSLVLAAGILGATIMPHAIYLHSALARDRHGQPAAGPARHRLLKATKLDVTVALLMAGAVNIALLLLGATALSGDDRTETLQGVHAALSDRLGGVTAFMFAVALLFSGLASTSVGCYAGSVVMDALLQVRIRLFTRRVLTAVPALAALALGFDPTQTLILSQVVLSFGIPFALIPLTILTSHRSVMGDDVNRPLTIAAAMLVTTLIVALNMTLLWLTFTGAA